MGRSSVIAVVDAEDWHEESVAPTGVGLWIAPSTATPEVAGVGTLATIVKSQICRPKDGRPVH